ncbi:DNA polymerase III subunit gamma/tau [Adlercreutzia sp. ZJ154]|uniref:DNA polymerase III subunit gamma/tau n=1 Tax=Adlercreutzia sp. ZJ154 TaxID=2709790 RepID=UPI0013EB3AD7|nr:DNA polymerase III subunit gamma/tau [Adlercreutzia sp. ZJ154]
MTEALYRKYRPQIFEDVVGQEHIERTLKNAIGSDKVSHAYLFTGPRGTGKTTTARLLAKALLCKNGPTPDPDGTCEDCNLVAAGEHPDVYELDAASRTGVENVREEIIGRVNYAPTRGRYKVYIIDEVHMLSTAAFNALLKTLEEPPAHVVFVLCTTDPQKVPETIHSRCQRFDFRRISNEELVSRLGAICEMEGIQFDGDALDLIAHRADGGMRDALTSLEQLIAFGDGKVTSELAERLLGSVDSSDLADIVRAIGTRDVAAAFRWTSEYMETGADLAQFAQDLAEHMRNMYVMQLAGADTVLDVSEAARRELESEAAWFGPERLANMLGVLGDLMTDLKTSTNQRLSFEIALTRMVRPDSDLTLAALAERVEALEAGCVATSETFSPSVQKIEEPVVAPVVVKPDEVVEQRASAVVQAVPDRETQPVASAVNISEAQLPQFWASAMAHLKKTAAAYGVLLMNARPKLEADHLIVQFPADTDFAFQASQKPEVKDAIADAISKAGAPGMPFTLVKSGASAQASTQAPAQASAQVSAQTPVQASAPAAAQVFAQPQPDLIPEPDSVPLSAYEDVDVADAPPWGETDIADTSSNSSALEPTADQLNDALAAAFGEGVTFQQVN